ncbi:TrmH family RNA methyltransferase [Chengkuizengella axinellae]|uniref:RNA methyltransferase n=1 Tax=Chengkuizengella axinellae TaxID=3064388 RepID=A0ABT9ITV7_9BACL|nr:RNA methyltransferase [Chengkuizengella sp. 2205SS18-9]MDP5272522.1 RNA methyltransferase [Chengkuizengella sp. 2205SS18-9]
MKITSLTNSHVKDWVKLLTKKGRDRQRKYIVEGAHLVKEALNSTNVNIEHVVYSEDKGIPNELLEYKEDRWISVSREIMVKCSDTKTPQGIFAVIHIKNWGETSLFNDKALVVVCDAIQDPGNLGTIIRSADAVGASGIILGKGCVDLHHPKTVRSTMGSLFHLPIVERDLNEILKKVENSSIQVINTSLQAESNCYEIDLTAGSWFIVGNEGSGVSPELNHYVNKQIKIPIEGQAESLNVAMASTIMLYEALRQRKYRV